MRRFFLAAAFVASVLSLGSTRLNAADYPDRPVTLVVPFAPGGGLDVLARSLSVELERRLGKPFVVENKPGAGSALGTDQVVRAAADGYTLLVTSDSLITNAAVTPGLRYDPITDLVPISAPYKSSYVLVANAESVQAKTLKDLIAELKANPGKYNYASSGIGGSPHLAAAYFIEKAGVDIAHVPLKGSGPMVSELLSGRVQLAFLGLSTTSQYIEEGTLKAFAVSAPERLEQLPEVPTFAEAGLPGFEVVTWSGVFAPKGTPQAILDLLQKEISGIVSEPAFAALIVKNGNRPWGSTPAELTAAVKDGLGLWKGIVQNAGIAAQ